METPVFQVGSLACFCACGPPQDGRPLKRGRINSEEEELNESLADRAWPQLGSRSKDADGANFFEKGHRDHLLARMPLQVVRKAQARSPDSTGSTADGTGPRRHGADDRAPPPFFAVPGDQVPRLGPVGAGGWHFEEEVTNDMRETAAAAEELYRQSEKKELTAFNKDFLTSVTLPNYVDPVSPEHLARALKGRARYESIFIGRQPLHLGCSFRVIGWDSTGASIVATEPCTMKNPLSYMMQQVEYVAWSAFDLNKPGAQGFSMIMDFGGGFTPWHFFNPKPILDLAAIVESQWRRRLKVAFLVDVPTAFQGVLHLFLKLVKENTRQKIKCVANMDVALKELSSMGCDQETIKEAEEYLRARRRRGEAPTWHPIVDNAWFRDRLSHLHMSEDTEYLTEEMHKEVRAAIQQFRFQRWGSPEQDAVFKATRGSDKFSKELTDLKDTKEERVVCFDAPSEYSLPPTSVQSRRSLCDLEAGSSSSGLTTQLKDGERGGTAAKGTGSPGRRGQKSAGSGSSASSCCLCGVLSACRRVLPCSR